MPEPRPPAWAYLLIASPRGFCAGVDRAIEIVELSLEVYGAPVYVRHEIVHNRHVVEDLRAKGAIFTDETSTVRPRGQPADLQRARGLARTCASTRARRLRTLDATCPLVTKVHVEAMRYARDGYDIALIGHRGTRRGRGHAGSRGRVAMHLIETARKTRRGSGSRPGSRVAVLTQTTLSVDDTRDGDRWR